MTTQEETEALEARHIVKARLRSLGLSTHESTRGANEAVDALEKAGLLSSSKAERELREALVSIRTECDPGFLPFKDPEDGRARLFAIADAALTAK